MFAPPHGALSIVIAGAKKNSIKITDETLIAVHGPHRFLGELSLLTGQAALGGVDDTAAQELEASLEEIFLSYYR